MEFCGVKIKVIDYYEGKSEDRNYRDWFFVKDDTQRHKNMPCFKEGQIWWCRVGENVGVEINGKGKMFVRPVVIFKKFSQYGFLGIPLTTQNHLERAPDWYVYFKFQNRNEYAALNQIETISSYRLCRLMGTLDDTDKRRILDGFVRLYYKKIPLL